MSSSSAPLLETGGGSGVEREQENTGRTWWGKLLDVEEAKNQIFFAVPMIITNISYYSITLVSVMFAGHLGPLELAGATLANSWATVTGLALMIGLSGALETLCGQAFGAGLSQMLGVYVQSSFLTSFFFSVIISVLWFYSKPLLVLLQQEPQMASMSGLYLRYLIPGLFAYGFIQCILRFLQTQSVVMPLVLFSVTSLLVHVCITYMLVHHSSLGFKGAACGASLSLCLSLVSLGLYVRYSRRFRTTWEGFSTECFHYVRLYLKLAIPSAVMVCLEYWAFELLVLLAGLMPKPELSTSLVAMCVNTENATYMITYGLSAAASTRVSNELGAGNVDRAKNAVAVSLKLSMILAAAIIVTLAFAHNTWASSFSNQPLIIKEFASMTPLLATSIFFDSAQGILSGVARGCGWQQLAAWTNLATFYVIGMPIAIFLGFNRHLHAKGLWIGLICGLCCQASSLLFFTLRTRWAKAKLSVNDN